MCAASRLPSSVAIVTSTVSYISLVQALESSSSTSLNLTISSLLWFPVTNVVKSFKLKKKCMHMMNGACIKFNIIHTHYKYASLSASSFFMPLPPVLFHLLSSPVARVTLITSIFCTFMNPHALHQILISCKSFSAYVTLLLSMLCLVVLL